MTLIVGRAGPLSDSVQAFLHTLPGSEPVLVAENERALVCTLALQRVDTVLVVDPAALNHQGTQLLQHARKEGLFARWLYLAADVEQERAATAAGADVVVLNGMPAPQLFALIGQLVTGNHEECHEC